MHHHPTTVSSLIVHGLINQMEIKDIEELVHNRFPELDRHTLWELQHRSDGPCRGRAGWAELIRD